MAQVSIEGVSILNIYDPTDANTLNKLDLLYNEYGTYPASYALAAILYTFDTDLYLAQMIIPYDDSTGFSDSHPFATIVN